MRKFSVVPGLFAGLVLLSAAAVSSAGVFLSVNFAPPALQIYEQPLCPVDGYIWTPGYWGYGDAGYYWVPGAWLAPPQVGFLWTPGYWGYAGSVYTFNAGYWGPTVGFYGGVNYGYGYGGSGYDGGRWQSGRFAYNTSVTRVNTTVVHNTYNQAVASHGSSRTSFNGGPGGIGARPSAAEAAVSRGHVQPASTQGANRGTSSGLSPANLGRPANTAAARPAAAPATAPNRSAEAPRHVAQTAPNVAQRNDRPAANTRVAPQQSQSVNRQPEHNAPSRPAQEQRPQGHAAAPEHTQAKPEGREERK